MTFTEALQIASIDRNHRSLFNANLTINPEMVLIKIDESGRLYAIQSDGQETFTDLSVAQYISGSWRVLHDAE